MGIELELAVLLAIAIVGPAFFSAFEVETPAWRKVLKWAVVCVMTLGLFQLVGHWAVVLPVSLGVAGVIVHAVWCRRNGIDAFHATPRRKYYVLRGWSWPE
jgi:peptidoglycan biosynthesis protein MviN/MurJ (putative lipid II flippase)